MKRFHKTHIHDRSRLIIDEIAYGSRLRTVSPFLKLFVSFFSLIICVFMKNIGINIFILISVILFMTAVGKTHFHDVLKIMSIPLAFILIGSIMLIFDVVENNGYAVLSFSAAGTVIGITRTGIVQGAGVFIQCVTASCCLLFIAVTTPMPEIMRTLKKLHIPDFFTEIMELVYRYIFVLLETADRIRLAQECRLGYRNIKTSFYSTGALVSNLFICAYKQAERTYTAMESRGYTGELRSISVEYKTPKRYMTGAVLYCITLIVFALVSI